MKTGIPLIRKYEPRDRDAVRRICCATALMGRPSVFFFEDTEVFADALTASFTDYEPESCFVAESNGKVIGYLIGARDSKTMDRVFSKKILFPLLGKALRRGTFFRKKNLRFFWGCLRGALGGEFKQPDFSTEYPAVLHINLDSEFRGHGTGRQLIAAYVDYLHSLKITGVHLATMSDAACAFFGKQGFPVLHKGKRSYFRPIIGTDVPVYICGKKI